MKSFAHGCPGRFFKVRWLQNLVGNRFRSGYNRFPCTPSNSLKYGLGKAFRWSISLIGFLMSTAKDAMVEIIARQPDDSSYDEILRELAYARMVLRGVADSDAGRTIGNNEVRARLESWSK